MKVYRIIVIIFAIILGFSFTTLMFFSPATQAAIKEPATEEYYDMLKENALKVAKTLDKNVMTNETLTADFYFSEDELVVTVSSTTAKLIAKIPISNHLLNIEDGTIISKGTVDFENIEYVEKNELQSTWWYIVISIGAGVFVSIVVYILFFEAWFSYKKEQ